MITRRSLLLALAIPALLAAQAAPQLTFGTAAKGEMAITFDLKAVGLTGAGMAALQFSLPSPASPVTMTLVNGPVVSSASKALSCAGNAAGRMVCILAGINANTLTDGTIATITIATPTISPQTFNVNVLDTLGASLAAAPIPITPPQMVTLSLTSRCDLNNDGKIDISDLAGAIGQAQGVAACTTADITGRGKCDVLDIQRIANAAVNGTCKVGQ